jgi:hypothetical protein
VCCGLAARVWMPRVCNNRTQKWVGKRCLLVCHAMLLRWSLNTPPPRVEALYMLLRFGASALPHRAFRRYACCANACGHEGEISKEQHMYKWCNKQMQSAGSTPSTFRACSTTESDDAAKWCSSPQSVWCAAPSLFRWQEGLFQRQTQN